ncbi:PREDICTED: probable glycosyltransferase At5g25310 isoform X4 [Lupinus angustifolius]|uniref:probable glycosyltransferase At5g25310 isoform X3 n=1 Tax=Lupinus angustifolius TaxID=3871 RepID=UPI00092E8919|nr:PREDICTED: probable glycosyltransferase At5g25310 isoform X3 [Lupinus angustifolius]XP_019438750.1 PREDICTED: probable glycosyltransferase At5g25310 isoform X4 [Lupinus angustifolius]
MGQKFVSIFTKSLLWLIAITMAVIFAFRYLELPYSNVLLSLFSACKLPTSGTSTFHATGPSPDAEILKNVTMFNQPNSVGEHVFEEVSKTRMSRENVTYPRNGFDLEPGSESNKSIGFYECNNSSIVDSVKRSGNVSATEQVGDSSYNNTMGLILLTNCSRGENFTSKHEDRSGRPYANSPEKAPTYIDFQPYANSPEKAPTCITPPLSSITKVSRNITNAVLSQLDNETISMKEENSSINRVPKENQDSNIPVPEVTSISEMNKLLLQSHASYRSVRPKWSSAVDQELLHARSEIENAPIVKNDPNLYAHIYQNVSMFKRSYELMEETLKVYIYREGAKPILHSPFLTGIYASEGWFMKLMEANKRFVTNDPKKAHLFYLPFSSRKLEEALYVEGSHSHKNLIQYLHDYVDTISAKHPFWNRTGGADHFLVGCHDWAPSETKLHMDKCIRALCNADVKEGFVFGKDVSLPETYVRNALNPTRELGGNSASKRTNLAFFAGSMHGYLRPILLHHWENKDPDMKIFGKLPKSKGNRNYIHYMKSSKYCICAKGYEVNSPRVVEAIFYECVPVIISDNFVPPFLEVLDWESFAVIIMEKDIPNLKSILLSIPEKKYLRLQMRIKKVQHHFLWHNNPIKYDIFHMILHSIWYNRVFSAISIDT